MCRIYKTSRILFVILFVLFGFFGFKHVRAQSIGIKISPVRVEEIVNPGEILTEQVKVTNDSTVVKTFYAYLRDFKAEGETGSPRLIAPGTEEGYYLASWIDITDQGLEFTPGEEKVITYQIKVPANAGPGGYYGAVLFGTVPPKLYQNSEDKGAGMAISQQTASLVLLQVRGDVDEEASIREFSTDKEIYSAPYDVNFLLRVENLGNVHVKPIGNISIINMFNKEVAEINVNEDGSNVLPKSIRRFNYTWSGENGIGKYTAKCGLSFGTPADLGGQGKQTLYIEKTFWIVPWKIVIPGIISISIVILLFVLFLRFYKSKAVRKALHQMGVGQVRYIRKYQGPSPALHFGLIIASLLIIAFIIGVMGYFIFLA